MPYSGDLSKIPNGWALCDGKNGNPDLRGRFLIGSGNFMDDFGMENYVVNAEGGERFHLLTLNEIPKHNHHLGSNFQMSFPRGLADGNESKTGGFKTAINHGSVNVNVSLNGYTDQAGGDQPHNNLPPYYVVHWIIKK